MTRAEAVNWIINISADIGKAQHSELWHYEQALSEIRDMLETEPEEKTGLWVKKSDADGVYLTCSECWNDLPRISDFDPQFDLFPKLKSIDPTAFCPHCGAKMKPRNS